MGPLGWQETLVIFVLALLIFGPKKLPELGKTIGKAITEFRRASSELKSTWDREMATLERENESIRDVTSSIQSELNDYASSYSYDGAPYEPSYDSTAESSYSVGASADQGAESTAGGMPDNGESLAGYSSGSEPAAEQIVAETASEPSGERAAATVSDAAPASQNSSPA
ncbi:MAG: twin-arginine translocase TatA/TatE family subunit [Bryobacteraceae bacterium]|nr:twin-arginine translocase TatA/TatE family subunit [Bryobacteraceae bacterium]